MTPPRRAGRWLVWLLVPQLGAGLWLALVPDGAVFVLTQAVTLAHVVASLALLPPLGWLVVRHARALLPQLVRWPQRFVVLGLLLALIGAVATGFACLGEGQGMPAARAHAITAALLVAPLLLHLSQGQRQRLAMAIGVGLAASAAAFAGLGKLVPSGPAPAPAFAYATRSTELYDPAHWCGECHGEIYAEWHRSAHARTLGIPLVRREIGKVPHLTQLDLANFGEIARAPADHASGARIDGAFPFESCTNCHSPTSFYGDDPRSITESAPPSRDGVTCSFCHTLRDVRPAGDLAAVVQQAAGHPQSAPVIAAIPLYVSAPETVRRYLGQASAQPALRWLGNALIRWRPEVHRRDHHAPLLDRSEACSGCHGAAGNSPDLPVRTYADWQTSPYAGRATECQDCHMARRIGQDPVKEPGSLVDWGPVRPQRRSHLFLGGNVKASETYRDRDLARLEHEFGVGAVSVRVQAKRGAAGVEVEAKVRNERAGHLFPSVDSNIRYAWVRIAVTDAQGKVLAETSPPREGPLHESETILFRCLDGDFGKRCDSAVPPLGERTVRITLPAAAERAAEVRAGVFQLFDPQPLAEAAAPVR